MGGLKKVGRHVWRGWMRFARLLGTVNRFVFMTLFYWVIIDFVNLVLRLLRVDLLDRRLRPRPSYWHPKSPHTGGYRHQF